MEHIETLVPISGAKRPPSPRVHGTFAERMRLHELAHRVVEIMKEIHPELSGRMEEIECVPLEFSWENKRKRTVCDIRFDRRTSAVLKIIIDRNLVFHFPEAAMAALHQQFLTALLDESTPVEHQHILEQRLQGHLRKET